MFRSMGERAFVRPGNSKVTVQRHALQINFDVPLVLAVVALSIFGLIMVYSASYDFSQRQYGSNTFVFFRQLLWMVGGFGICAALTLFDYHRWQKLAVFALLATLVGLITVLILNEVIHGAARSLFNGSVQPSELSKVILIIYLAVWLYAKREQIRMVTFGLIPLGFMLGIIGGLIYRQPDLSAVLTIMFLGGIMFFLGGGEIKQIIFMVAFALVVGYLVVSYNPTGIARVTDFQLGLKDPFQASYHVRRSLEAFVRGSWMGVGIGNSETKLTGLPFPQTDSIFAVIGEETGVAGAILVAVLYIMLLWRGITISRRAPDQLGRLMAAGLSVWIAVEAFFNMAGMVNLLPFSGSALPFISAGGSNLIVSFIAIGTMLNISRTTILTTESQGEGIGAVTNLRGRNRWRDLSGARRPTKDAE